MGSQSWGIGTETRNLLSLGTQILNQRGRREGVRGRDCAIIQDGMARATKEAGTTHDSEPRASSPLSRTVPAHAMRRCATRGQDARCRDIPPVRARSSCCAELRCCAMHHAGGIRSANSYPQPNHSRGTQGQRAPAYQALPGQGTCWELDLHVFRSGRGSSLSVGQKTMLLVHSRARPRGARSSVMRPVVAASPAAPRTSSTGKPGKTLGRVTETRPAFLWDRERGPGNTRDPPTKK
jgi:hypothetical protein